MVIPKLWQAVAGLFLVVIVVGGGVQWIRGWLDSRDADNRAQITSIINDSTQAQSARLKIQKDSLAALIDAGKTMGGKVVAGVKIVVRPETIYVKGRDVGTVVNAVDSSRTAMLTDTTKGYMVTVTAVAPKYPAPLRLGYTLVTPEFRPEVGFVQRSDGYYAVVSWAGRDFEVKNAFFAPPKVRPISLVAGADFRGSPTATTVTGAALSYDAYLGLKYTAGQWNYLLSAGHNGLPFVGLGVQKKLW